jgi:hypothetical protein
MKRALTGIASVGILAVAVGVETANAQSYRRYSSTNRFAETRNLLRLAIGFGELCTGKP